MKVATIVLGLVCFGTGYWTGMWTCRRHFRARANKTSAYQEMGVLLDHRILLVEMRERRLASAIESAEFSVDCAVSALWHQLRRIDDTQRSRAVEALHAVRGYRERWPREVKAEILASDGLSTAQISKIADEAREILADLPKEPPGKDGGAPPSSARLVEGWGRGL